MWYPTRDKNKALRYKSVVVAKRGGLEVLQINENDLRTPSPGEARGKIRAAPMCLPDVEAHRGRTPFPVKTPFLKTFPIPEAAQANELMESAQVTGNIVLIAPDLVR